MPDPARLERSRAYSYVRFSTPEQAVGDSLRRQTEAARAYAERAGLQLDEDLKLHDKGISAFNGLNAQTGYLGAFLRKVQEGDVPKGSYLIVESLDRISRQTVRKAARTMEDIVEAGINVVDLSDGGKVYNVENLETDPFLFVMMVLRFIRANEESTLKSRRVRDANDQKRREAASNLTPFTSRRPGWLAWDSATKRFSAIPARAQVIREIYELAADGRSYHTIAQMLNERHEPTWGKSAYWRGTYVRKVLGTSAVIGTFTPNVMTKGQSGRSVRQAQQPIGGYFPVVVDRELFERVTARLKSTAARGRNAGAEPRSIFAGLMKCGHCGQTVTRVTKGEHVYLVCTRANAKAGCRYQTLRYSHVEERFCEMAEWLVDEAPRGRDTSELEQQIANMTGLEFALEDETKDLADLAIEQKSTAARTRLREKEEELEGVQQELRRLRGDRDRLTAKTVTRKLEAIRTALLRKPLDVTETNRVLREAISRIVVDPEQAELVVWWHHADEPSEPIYFVSRHMRWTTR